MKPLLLDFAISRRDEQSPQYFYDDELNLNIIYFDGHKLPFIDSICCDPELVTKTDVVRERDDETKYCAEILTKTFVKRERDDESSAFTELLTKTRVARESDDENDTLSN